MNYKIVNQDGTTYITIEGTLDAVSVSDMRGELDALVNSRPKAVDVDLSQLRLIDSSGVGALVSLYKRVREKGGTVAIRGVRDQPLAIFQLLQLDRFMVKRAAIADVAMHPLGYKILVEVIGRGRVRWIAEVGYVFRERHQGESKVTWRVYIDYLRHLVRLRLDALSTTRFLRFAVVGASGVLVDMAVLFLLSDPRSLGLGLTRSKIVAAELAIISNFLLNDAWTFRDLVGTQRGARHKLRRLLKFNAVCGIGLLLNVALLNFQFNVLHINRYVANLIAIGVVTAWNYWLNLKLNWRDAGAAG